MPASSNKVTSLSCMHCASPIYPPGAPPFLCPAVERFLAALWGWAWEPMLFVTIGASINFSTLNSGIFPRSIIIILTGQLRSWTECIHTGRGLAKPVLLALATN